MTYRYCKLYILLIVSIIFAGCESASTYHDNSAFLESRPRSIVVIPPLNNSIEVNASYTFLSTISKPLAEKGYYVFPVAVIDLFMKENGLPGPAEMNNIPLDKIRENIGADAALYIVIDDWGQKYQVLSSAAVVHADLRLIDTRSGALLWSGRARAEHSSDNGQNGLAGALIGAIVDQVAGSVIDHTYDLSREANNKAIYQSGFLDGPYRLPD
ncbi:DUF799 domain-containing protein [Agarilytica rhodophyticola]|uniref:DUF799 domain-containing protein n=1 Tax=Agarilytica rhodophyticola TaxID=1737490 RepID=UPI000B34212E|nr:GNA1162 family protein [Agarilytica rhodophyticola]